MVRSKHRQLLVGDSLFLLWPPFYKRERSIEIRATLLWKTLGLTVELWRGRASGILGPSSPLTDPGGGHAASSSDPLAPPPWLRSFHL